MTSSGERVHAGSAPVGTAVQSLQGCLPQSPSRSFRRGKHKEAAASSSNRTLGGGSRIWSSCLDTFDTLRVHAWTVLFSRVWEVGLKPRGTPIFVEACWTTLRKACE